MMTTISPEDIFNEMDQFGHQHVNPQRVEKYARYFKEGYDAFGLDEGLLDQKVAEFLGMPGMNLDLVQRASHLLVASPKYEMASCAIRLLLAFKKEWDRSTFLTVGQWFSTGITNWAHTDYICAEITPLMLKKKIISLDDLVPWRESGYRFQRRASVVSLIKPMKQEPRFDPCFQFIVPVMHDPERVVHQALGWLLREMWKKQPLPVEAFLMQYRETAPRLIFQYATEKMPKADREKFRRSRKTGDAPAE